MNPILAHMQAQLPDIYKVSGKGYSQISQSGQVITSGKLFRQEYL